MTTTKTRKRSAEREEFLADIITTAVEGGTGYWAGVSEYRWEGLPDREHYAVLHEMSQDPDNDEVLPGGNDWHGHYLVKPLRLDIEAVASAVSKITRGEAFTETYDEGPGDPLGEWFVKLLREASRENDSGNIDASGADLIAQVALLGIVRYG